jgi:hypothetical protein
MKLIRGGSAFLKPVSAVRSAGRSGLLLSDAERRENPVQDVVRRCRSRNRVNGAQRAIEVDQQHLVRNAQLHRYPGILQRLLRFHQKLAVPHARDAAALGRG